MRSPFRQSLNVLALATLVAAALPAAADPVTAAPAPASSCRVPQAGTPAPVAPRPDLSAEWSRLAAEIPKAQADGVRPLNTRGYNYATGGIGVDQSALDFEARGR